MPAIKKKGEPIAIRLDLHVDDAARRLAEESGQSISQYCFEILTAHINARLNHPSMSKPSAALMLADYRHES